MQAVYQINWKSFIGNNLPIDFRQPDTISWLEVLLKPLKDLHTAFLQYRTEALYKINNTGQICYIQKVLNDAIDPYFRRIMVKNARVKMPVYFYEPQENKPVSFYEPADNLPVYFRENIDFEGAGADFIVYLHSDLQPGIPEVDARWFGQIHALIEYYKLFSKTYRLETYYT
jgi:hypothetical protein